MPIKYKDYGLIKENEAVRNSCAFFDVSHMGQVRITGKDSLNFIERVTTNDIKNLSNYSGCLSLILNDKAGIIDDSIVSKIEDNHYNIVLNAGNKLKDLNHFYSIIKNEFPLSDIKINYKDCYSLIALQGPKTHEIVQSFVKTDLNKIGFMESFEEVINIKGKEVPIFVIRAGYTGEDGFEISVHDNDVVDFADYLFDANNGYGIVPAGLGARDSARLESGLCLHGNDITELTTPFESGLNWCVRKESKYTDFIGKEEYESTKLKKGLKKRFGFVGVEEKGPCPRTHYKIENEEGKEIGEVTSGIYSTYIKKNIGMGYLLPKYLKKDSNDKLLVDIRGKKIEILRKKMPFIEQRYFRKSK